MGAVVLDASVVLALLDPTNALHAAAALAVSAERGAGRDLVLSAGVRAEGWWGWRRPGTSTACVTWCWTPSAQCARSTRPPPWLATDDDGRWRMVVEYLTRAGGVR